MFNFFVNKYMDEVRKMGKKSFVKQTNDILKRNEALNICKRVELHGLSSKRKILAIVLKIMSHQCWVQ